MIKDNYPYSIILMCIKKGEENAVSAGEIANILSLSDTRQLRLYIENLRKEVCICSSPNGYYFPKDKDEAVKWRNHMLGVMNKYAGLAKSADRYIGEG